MNPLVSYQRSSAAVSVLAMDDGKRNALSPAMLTALNEGLDQAEADGTAVVLTGREGVFSAGFDLKVMQGDPDTAVGMVQNGFRLSARLLRHPAPVVIACTGHALAMASFLLLSGDYRLGAAGDFKIGANEVAIGMAMPQAAIEISRQRLAPVHLSRALINAEIYGPDAAIEAGFLDRAVPADALAAEALAVAEQLATLHRKAHAQTKLAVRREALTALDAAIAHGEDQLRKGVLRQTAPA